MNESATVSTPRRLARPDKAAAHFGMGRSTLELWARTKPGFPQPTRCGPRFTLYDLDAIESFLAAQGAQRGNKVAA